MNNMEELKLDISDGDGGGGQDIQRNNQQHALDRHHHFHHNQYHHHHLNNNDNNNNDNDKGVENEFVLVQSADIIADKIYIDAIKADVKGSKGSESRCDVGDNAASNEVVGDNRYNASTSSSASSHESGVLSFYMPSADAETTTIGTRIGPLEFLKEEIVFYRSMFQLVNITGSDSINMYDSHVFIVLGKTNVPTRFVDLMLKIVAFKGSAYDEHVGMSIDQWYAICKLVSFYQNNYSTSEVQAVASPRRSAASNVSAEDDFLARCIDWNNRIIRKLSPSSLPPSFFLAKFYLLGASASYSLGGAAELTSRLPRTSSLSSVASSNSNSIESASTTCLLTEPCDHRHQSTAAYSAVMVDYRIVYDGGSLSILQLGLTQHAVFELEITTNRVIHSPANSRLNSPYPSPKSTSSTIYGMYTTNTSNTHDYFCPICGTTFYKGVCSKYKINRRYSDFELLVDMLHKGYPGVIVPPYPGKHWVVTKSDREQVAHDRKTILQKFLDDILMHPVLRDSFELKVFLEASGEGFAAFRGIQKYFIRSSSTTGAFSRVVGSTPSSTSFNLDLPLSNSAGNNIAVSSSSSSSWSSNFNNSSSLLTRPGEDIVTGGAVFNSSLFGTSPLLSMKKGNSNIAIIGGTNLNVSNSSSTCHDTDPSTSATNGITPTTSSSNSSWGSWASSLLVTSLSTVTTIGVHTAAYLGLNGGSTSSSSSSSSSSSDYPLSCIEGDNSPSSDFGLDDGCGGESTPDSYNTPSGLLVNNRIGCRSDFSSCSSNCSAMLEKSQEKDSSNHINHNMMERGGMSSEDKNDASRGEVRDYGVAFSITTSAPDRQLSISSSSSEVYFEADKACNNNNNNNQPPTSSEEQRRISTARDLTCKEKNDDYDDNDEQEEGDYHLSAVDSSMDYTEFDDGDNSGWNIIAKSNCQHDDREKHIEQELSKALDISEKIRILSTKITATLVKDGNIAFDTSNLREVEGLSDKTVTALKSSASSIEAIEDFDVVARMFSRYASSFVDLVGGNDQLYSNIITNLNYIASYAGPLRVLKYQFDKVKKIYRADSKSGIGINDESSIDGDAATASNSSAPVISPSLSSSSSSSSSSSTSSTASSSTAAAADSSIMYNVTIIELAHLNEKHQQLDSLRAAGEFVRARINLERQQRLFWEGLIKELEDLNAENIEDL